MHKKNIMSIAFFFVASICYSQETQKGDSAIAAAIDARLSELYDKYDTTAWYISKRQFQKINACGTNITYSEKSRKPVRISVVSITESGEFGEEYWFDNGNLIFVYQTFGYFNESPSLSRAVNFKGQRFWESRYYFENNSIKFEKTTGIKERTVKYTLQDFFAEKERLLAFVKSKTQGMLIEKSDAGNF